MYLCKETVEDLIAVIDMLIDDNNFKSDRQEKELRELSNMLSNALIPAGIIEIKLHG